MKRIDSAFTGKEERVHNLWQWKPATEILEQDGCNITLCTHVEAKITKRLNYTSTALEIQDKELHTTFSIQTLFKEDGTCLEG